MSEEKLVFIQFPVETSAIELRQFMGVLAEHKLKGYQFIVGNGFSALTKGEVLKILGEMK